KETNRTAMTLVVLGGVVFVALVVSLLVWFFTRKPPALEMIKYLPDDAVEASGLNLGHMHKYSEFIKVVEPTYKEQGFQKAIDALAKVYDVEPAAFVDNMVQGEGKSGPALVIRTKKEIDPELLAKLPGASKPYSNGGQTYYQISPIPKLWSST